MKMYGDVSEEYKNLGNGLEDMETLIKSLDNMSGEIKAKCMVAMAHDWLMMGMEDKAEKLLAEAESLCPLYFDGKMQQHMMEDEDFNKLCVNLQGLLLKVLTELLEFK